MSKKVQTLKVPVKAVKPAFKATSKQDKTKPVPQKSAAKLNAITKVVAKQNKMPPQTGGQKHYNEKTGKEKSPDKMDENLKSKSPWYASLRDPVQGAGAKIPDETGINTATMQLVQKVSVSINAQGVAGVEVISPYINNCGVGQVSENWKSTASTATGAALTWSSNNNFTNASSMISVAQAHRVVSAGVFAEYEGSSLNDTGDFTCYFLPYAPNANTQIASIQSRYGTSIIPVNKARRKPAAVLWFPINYESQSYKDFLSPQALTFGAGDSERWTMGIIAQGLQPTSGTVLFTFCVNYEFVPTLNTVDYITPSASPIDPIEEQLVQQWIAEDQMTGMFPSSMVDVQPGSQVVEPAVQGINSDSGFGMLGGIITELAPMLIGALL